MSTHQEKDGGGGSSKQGSTTIRDRHFRRTHRFRFFYMNRQLCLGLSQCPFLYGPAQMNSYMCRFLILSCQKGYLREKHIIGASFKKTNTFKTGLYEVFSTSVLLISPVQLLLLGLDGHCPGPCRPWCHWYSLTADAATSGNDSEVAFDIGDLFGLTGGEV